MAAAPAESRSVFAQPVVAPPAEALAAVVPANTDKTAATSAPATTATVSAGSGVAAAPNPLPGLGQTALSLMLVLGLIFALAWLLKRVQGVRVGGAASLRINAGLQVGPKEKVLMIEAGGQHLLIGVTASQINTLHVFAEAPVASANDADGKPAQPPVTAAFAEALKRALGQESKS